MAASLRSRGWGAARRTGGGRVGGVGLARDTPVRRESGGRSRYWKVVLDEKPSRRTLILEGRAWTHPQVPSNADSIPETHEIIIRR